MSPRRPLYACEVERHLTLYLLRSQLAEDVLQDAAVAEVFDFLRGVDADFCFEGFLLSVAGGGGHFDGAAGGELIGETVAEAYYVVGFFAGEAERFGGFSILELQGKNAHSNEIGPVDALVAFGDGGANAEQ